MGVEHHHPDCRCGKCEAIPRWQRNLRAGALSVSCTAALVSLGVESWAAVIAGVALATVAGVIDGFR